jgi:hypothetical protein
VESNERNAAGNGGVFSFIAGIAIGCALAGLLELTRTFGAFENLQFIPTDATEASFVSWTWAMLAAPVAVIASAIVVALSLPRTRTLLVAASVGLVSTLWLAARVWENVTGYLVISDQGPPFATTPLPPQRWPFVYRHGIAVVLCGVILTLAAVVYTLWRTRPRSVAFALGVLLALGIVFGGGQFGFAAMSFLRLRNLSAAAALIDVMVVALVLRQRRFDVILLLAFLILTASAWRLDRSWRAMLIEMPHGIETPAW